MNFTIEALIQSLAAHLADSFPDLPFCQVLNPKDPQPPALVLRQRHSAPAPNAGTPLAGARCNETLTYAAHHRGGTRSCPHQHPDH